MTRAKAQQKRNVNGAPSVVPTSWHFPARDIGKYQETAICEHLLPAQQLFAPEESRAGKQHIDAEISASKRRVGTKTLK